jgi:hypothetical protein
MKPTEGIDHIDAKSPAPQNRFSPPFTRVTMERAMINWPELLCHAEDWAKRFLTGAAVASLLMIAGTVMMVLVRAVWNPVVRLA